MNALAALPAFQPFVVTTLVLGANLAGLANATAFTRGVADEVINPEDVALNKKAKVVYDAGNDKTARYRRAHRNALENTPVFITTSLVLTLMGSFAGVAAALFYAYAALRVVHSVCYVRGIQPFRTLSFALALIVQVVVLGLIGWGTFVG